VSPVLRGAVLKLGDDVPGLDGIVSAEADGLFFAGRLAEGAEHLFRPVLGDAIVGRQYTFVVGGRNLGHGHGHYYWSAVALLREAGVQALFATSFPYGLARMAVNAGLPALEWPLTGSVDDGDELEVDLDAASVRNLTQGTDHRFDPLPEIVADLLRAGGIAPYTAARLAASAASASSASAAS
jgi:3-isopropylmalate/(R)-2-methylmalate dehydratase small subunit